MSVITDLLWFVDLRLQIRDVRLWRRQVPRFIQLLQTLTLDEAQLLSQKMFLSEDVHPELVKDIAYMLAQINMFVPGALQPLTSTFIAHHGFYPGQLYLEAGEQACQQLLSLANEPSSVNINHLLQALAWVGNEEVQAQFHAWRLHPPTWREDLYIPPEAYADIAGWELTAEGKRRDLYFTTCFELILAEQERSSQSLPATDMTTQEHCAWCQRPLLKLLDLDLRVPQCRWISLEGERLCIAVCPHCSFYITTFLDITPTGEALWSLANGDKPTLLEQIPDGGDDGEEWWPTELLYPGKARRTPFEAVGRFMLDEPGASQLGGHPEWIDDSTYPQCPTCQQTMPFLAQIAGEDWQNSLEGSFYVFLCPSCGKAATLYQQT